MNRYAKGIPLPVVKAYCRLSLFGARAGLLGFLTYGALKEHAKHNNWLRQAPQETIDRLSARNAYLTAKDWRFNAGDPALRRMALAQYDALPPDEKQRIFDQYQEHMAATHPMPYYKQGEART